MMTHDEKATFLPLISNTFLYLTHIYAPTLFAFSKVEIRFPLRRSEDVFLADMFSIYRYFVCTVAIIPLGNKSTLSYISLA